MDKTPSAFDVVIVGGGNAGLCAAHAACEAGARVCVLEKAPSAWAGGNTAFTAGAFRVAFERVADLRGLLEQPDELDRAEVEPYPAASYLSDLMRVTDGRSDPDLAEVLVNDSLETAQWLATKGIRWGLLGDRQSFVVDGRRRYWGNLILGAIGGGRGLVQQHLAAAASAGMPVIFDQPVVDLLIEDQVVAGVRTQAPDGREEIVRAHAVVVASGGFESSPRYRAQFLGPGWDLAKVRGTPFNTGELLMATIRDGAAAVGHWSGSHSIAWDAAAAPYGDPELTNRLSRQSYPFGVVVNRNGERFLDEGEDFRNYTYAKYGAEIMRQPGGVAFQLFDAKTARLLHRVDYDTATASRKEAATIAELAEALGINREQLVRTVEAFNASVAEGSFDPTRKDGKGTQGVQPPKSNWALPLDSPPFVGFAVACGVTFTFGGLRVDPQARVLNESGHPIDGLFAAGETVGGLFYHNYPGGSGLMAGSVFGRRAGRNAALRAIDGR